MKIFHIMILFLALIVGNVVAMNNKKNVVVSNKNKETRKTIEINAYHRGLDRGLDHGLDEAKIIDNNVKIVHSFKILENNFEILKNNVEALQNNTKIFDGRQIIHKKYIEEINNNDKMIRDKYNELEESVKEHDHLLMMLICGVQNLQGQIDPLKEQNVNEGKKCQSERNEILRKKTRDTKEEIEEPHVINANKDKKRKCQSEKNEILRKKLKNKK